MPDINYTPLSFANVHGTPAKWYQVDVYPDHAPGQWRISYLDGYSGDFRSERVVPAPDLAVVSDVLKFSNCSYIVVVVHGTLPGGIEDCVDVNNGSHNITVRAEVFAPRGKYVATIKGGSHDIDLSGYITSGAETDIDLGNWSDQSSERTRGVYLRLQHVQPARAVRVRVLHAHEPLLHLGPYKVDTRFKGIFRHVYFLLKKLGLA